MVFDIDATYPATTDRRDAVRSFAGRRPIFDVRACGGAAHRFSRISFGAIRATCTATA
jgi:hypothetical protein